MEAPILILIMLIAVIVRRTKVALAVITVASLCELIVSDFVPISYTLKFELSGFLQLALFYLMRKLTITDVNQEVTKYIGRLALCCSGVSFIKVAAIGLMLEPYWFNIMQGFAEASLLWLTIAIIACLFMLPDRPVGLHELVRDMRDGAARMGIHAHNNGRKT